MKLICQMSVSLDGYFEGPQGELDWHEVDEEFNAYAIALLDATRVMLMGRRMYQLMATAWPTAPDDSGVKRRMNHTPKLVFSRTLAAVWWQGARLAQGTLAEEVARLKTIPGDGVLTVGGSELAAACLDLGLLDELRVIVTPVVLGAGRPFLAGCDRRALALCSTRTFQSGSVVMTYRLR